MAIGWKHALAGLALVGFAASAQAPLDVRVALVIGNSAYAGAAALPNPANDAVAMAAALRRVGFQVTELKDGTREQMASAIAEVKNRLAGQRGVGMFYYAGHGLQLDWRNYMVPLDARLASAADVPAQTVHVDAVIDAFKSAGNRMNIVVLDACRDNPFAGTASAKGLAQLDAPPGTFLAYATAPGNTADDGASGNGLYTSFLLQELGRPTARIEDVFKRVRLQVRQKSGGRQVPWESTSLEEDFVFNDGRAAAQPAAQAAAPLVAAATAAAPGPAPLAAPVSKLAPADRERLFAIEKAEWDRIRESRNPDDFFAFLQKYPNGLISEAAQEKLDLLAKPQVTATPVQGRQPVQRDPRPGDEVEFVYRDYLTKLETRRETLRVTAIRDGQVELNNGAQVITIGGATVKNDQGVLFDPPLQTLPVGDFQVGRKWVARSTQTLPASINPRGDARGWVELELKVVAYEEITTPAGTFPTYRIESVLRSHNGLYGNVTYWVTSTGLVARYERRARLHNGRDHSWIREVARVHRPRG